MMNLSNQTFSLDLLRTFVVVADTQNFTRAAERLNCVQSAVSMQIQRLEESLQVRLLERSKRRVNLTAEGRILLQYGQRILHLKEQALAEIEHRSLFGKVRIGASDTAMCYLPDVLKAFSQRYPQIDVELQCGRSWEVLDELEAGKVDLAYVTQKCGRRGGREISRSNLVWAAAANSDVDQMIPVPLAIFAPGCIYRKAAIEALDKAGRDYRFAYESPSRAGLEQVIAAGLAVTIIPEDRVDPGLRIITEGEISTPTSLPPLPPFSTYLFGASRQSASIQAFAGLLEEVVKTPATAQT
ncbi:LysR family transcriptional regulator [Rhodovibrionaceae bacterium A322]